MLSEKQTNGAVYEAVMQQVSEAMVEAKAKRDNLKKQFSVRVW